MRWLEIITIRSAGNIPKPVIAELLRQMDQIDDIKRPAAIKMYHHAGMDTDVSIHIHWNSISGSQGKSPLGLMLSHALKEFGLLNHSIWIEEEQP